MSEYYMYVVIQNLIIVIALLGDAYIYNQNEEKNVPIKGENSKSLFQERIISKVQATSPYKETIIKKDSLKILDETANKISFILITNTGKEITFTCQKIPREECRSI